MLFPFSHASIGFHHTQNKIHSPHRGLRDPVLPLTSLPTTFPLSHCTPIFLENTKNSLTAFSPWSKLFSIFRWGSPFQLTQIFAHIINSSNDCKWLWFVWAYSWQRIILAFIIPPGLANYLSSLWLFGFHKALSTFYLFGCSFDTKKCSITWENPPKDRRHFHFCKTELPCGIPQSQTTLNIARYQPLWVWTTKI